jgi:hypothetical protein
MKRIASLVTAALAAGLTAFAQAAPNQPAPGAQTVDPSTQPAPSQQPAPAEEATMPPSSSGPSASTPAPEESNAAPAVGPDARSGTSSAVPVAPAAQPEARPDTRLAAITPPGMSTEEACTGFKSLVECAAAMHAAQNLSIPYGDLKSKLTGGRKLSAAIHDLKPDANAPGEARRAEDQARSDVRVPQG